MLQIYSVAKMSDPRYSIRGKKKKIGWDAWLAQSVKRATLDLKAGSLSLVLGVEMT